MGGNVRVGLEDSLWIGQGPARQVQRRAGGESQRILEELGLEVATPADAREMLKLKGGRNVGF